MCQPKTARPKHHSKEACPQLLRMLAAKLSCRACLQCLRLLLCKLANNLEVFDSKEQPGARGKAKPIVFMHLQQEAGNTTMTKGYATLGFLANNVFLEFTSHTESQIKDLLDPRHL